VGADGALTALRLCERRTLGVSLENGQTWVAGKANGEKGNRESCARRGTRPGGRSAAVTASARQEACAWTSLVAWLVSRLA